MTRQRIVNRRDFLNGCALGIAAGTSLTPVEAIAQGLLDQRALPADYYPPVLQGMRGSHDGSFEVAHAMRDGSAWSAGDAGDGAYDLVVVGGGISGLAAAYFYRKRHGPDARILILDNHDDIGGHAKRNEFCQDGRMHLVNGGTLNVEAPSQYSTVAAGLLWELGIDRNRYFERNADRWSHYESMGMSSGFFFDKETFGGDKLVPGYSKIPAGEFAAQSPFSESVRRDMVRLYDSKKDYLPGLSADEKRQKLAHMSDSDYAIKVVKCHPDVVKLFDPQGLLVTSIDSVPAIYCREMGYPGFDGLGLADISPDQLYSEPGGQHGRENQARAQSGDPDMYFPDGNATITRLLVRALIPDAVPGKSMEDVITSRVNYSLLDRDENKVRVRLNSPVVQVKNLADGRVQTSYVSHGDACSVMSGASVLACWNSVIPYLCEEIPQAQKEALAYGAKAPLVYTNVLLSNWRSLVDARVSYVTAPGSFHQGLGLQASLAMGDYRTSRSPDDPIVLRMSAYFYSPGMSRRDQHRAGRKQLLNTSFDSFEYNIRDQLSRILGPTGFDEEHDILGIIVNRWPHGYTYSYNSLFEPDEWAFTSSPDRPAVKARQSVGRISIANADAAASPHTDAAINEAYRAVSELFA